MKRRNTPFKILVFLAVFSVMVTFLIIKTGLSNETPLPAEADEPGSAAVTQPAGTQPPTVLPEPSLPPEETTPAVAVPETALPEDPAIAQAKLILAGMTTWEKVCQLFVVTPESLTDSFPTTAAGPVTKAALEKYPVGGVVYNSSNLLSPEQAREMIDNIQSFSRLGLFVAADEEGGIVNRLMKTLGTTYIESMYHYKDEGTDTAYGNAATIARDMAAYGFNTDFAPVADVWSNKDNTVIGERAYSDDYEKAAGLVAAAVRGFLDNGIICTLKHFPGHGDTSEDSHYESAYVTKTEAQLMREEMLPFKSGIAAGADMVMLGHLIVPSIDDVPATLSHTIVTGLLRDKLGFDGVVITDSLAMNAVADHYTTAEIAVKALQAGADILLGPKSLEKAADGIMAALESGELTMERIDESVMRILLLKIGKGIVQTN
jgi:beta-N-acetylhexosaminidase